MLNFHYCNAAFTSSATAKYDLHVWNGEDLQYICYYESKKGSKTTISTAYMFDGI